VPHLGASSRHLPRSQCSTLSIGEVYDPLSVSFVSSLVMALVVIPFKFVCRLAQRVHALDVRHSQMSTTRTCGISVNLCVVAFYALHLRRDIGRMATTPQFTNQMTVFSPLGIRGECRSPRLHSGQTSDAEHLSCWSPERALCFSYSGRTLKFARI